MTSTKLVFDPFSDDFFNHPYETYRRLRDEAPVYYNETYNFWALSRHEDVAAATKDFATYSSAQGPSLEMVLNPNPDMPTPPLVIMLDPPEHGPQRSLVNKVFTPRAMQALEPMIREKIGDVLATVRDGSFDAVEDFSALFPVEIITTMLGVPAESRQQIRLWLDKTLQREYGSIATPPEGVQAAVDSGVFYYMLIQERRAAPQDDMISKLIAVSLTAEDGTVTQLDDIQIAGFLTLLGGAGAETVTKLIGNAVVTFAQNPDQWQLLLEDRSKVPAAVEELLRYEAPAQYLVRYTMRDVQLHGTTIPKGSAVLLIVGSANRDERAFPDVDKFDIERDRSVAQNLGLGYGIHSCLGAALARMESRIALEMLLDLMPKYEVDRAGLRRVAMTNVAGWSSVPVTIVK